MFVTRSKATALQARIEEPILMHRKFANLLALLLISWIGLALVAECKESGPQTPTAKPETQLVAFRKWLRHFSHLRLLPRRSSQSFQQESPPDPGNQQQQRLEGSELRILSRTG